MKTPLYLIAPTSRSVAGRAMLAHGDHIEGALRDLFEGSPAVKLQERARQEPLLPAAGATAHPSPRLA